MSTKLRKEDIIYVDWGKHRDIYKYAVPITWPNYSRSEEIQDWLEENIGKGGEKGKWHIHRQHYIFKTEKDAMFFLLRWGA